MQMLTDFDLQTSNHSLEEMQDVFGGVPPKDVPDEEIEEPMVNQEVAKGPKTDGLDRH